MLKDPEIQSEASHYDDAKPLSGRIDAKTNRIAVNAQLIIADVSLENSLRAQCFVLARNKGKFCCTKRA